MPKGQATAGSSPTRTPPLVPDSEVLPEHISGLYPEEMCPAVAIKQGKVQIFPGISTPIALWQS